MTDRAAFGIAYRLYRGYFGCDAAGTGAGEHHRQQGKESGADKNNGIDGNGGDDAIEPGNDDRCQFRADEPAADETEGDPDQCQQQRLMTNDLPQLFRRGTDGFQQTVKADIVGNGDLKDVVNDEISGK